VVLRRLGECRAIRSSLMLAAGSPPDVETGVPNSSEKGWTRVGPDMPIVDIVRKDILFNFSIVCIDLEFSLPDKSQCVVGRPRRDSD